MLSQIVFPSWRDRFWIFCVLAGPVFWLFYALINDPVSYAENDNLFAMLLLVIIVYPVLEEIVFRGWLQTELCRRKFFQFVVFRISNANIFTSILFSLFHLINHGPLWATLVFFPSILFGHLRDSYGVVTPSILLHMFYNGGFFVLFLI